MSRTFDVVCDQCRKALWIGQGGPTRVHLYTGYEDFVPKLLDFLREHLNCTPESRHHGRPSLRVVCSDLEGHDYQYDEMPGDGTKEGPDR